MMELYACVLNRERNCATKVVASLVDGRKSDGWAGGFGGVEEI